jgi:lipoprotein-releasing system permease protein
LRTRILGVASHVQVFGMDGALPDWPRVAEEARAHQEVVSAAPFIEAQAMLTAGPVVRGVMLRGIEPELEDTVADFSPHMRSGRLTDLRAGEFGIILGSDLARNLRVEPGDRVTVISPQAAMTPVGVIPRFRVFTLVGVFDVGMYEYDSGLALVHLADAQRLYQMKDAVTGVRLKLKDLFDAPWVTGELADLIHSDAYLSNWTKSHATFFRAVQIEKNIMFLILSLIVAVATFNIVSTLVMSVADKKADIAILRTLGARPGSIMLMFIVQGALIGISGLALGVLGGVAMALNIDVLVPLIERLLGTQMLAKDIYFLSELPSELRWSDVWSIVATAFSLTLVATVYPSWRAARVNPAEALRYE